MKLKRARNFEDMLEIKPVTDEEFEELLNEIPRKELKKRKRFKKGKKKEF